MTSFCHVDKELSADDMPELTWIACISIFDITLRAHSGGGMDLVDGSNKVNQMDEATKLKFYNLLDKFCNDNF